MTAWKECHCLSLDWCSVLEFSSRTRETGKKTKINENDLVWCERENLESDTCIFTLAHLE
jgi:hypothetical protein